MKILSTEEIHLQKDTTNVEKWCEENTMPLKKDKCNLLNLKSKMEVTLFITIVDTAKTQENRISKTMGAFYKIKRNFSKKNLTKVKVKLIL